MGSPDCESLWLEILTNQGNFVLGVVYRHPVSTHALFREMFLNTIRYLSDHKHLYYICGDFSIILGNLEVEYNIKYDINSLISLSCKLLISKPTRVSDHSATIIDHMYTNDNKHDTLSDIPIYEISDHLPIFRIAKQIKPNARNIYKNNQFRDMKCFALKIFYLIFNKLIKALFLTQTYHLIVI